MWGTCLSGMYSPLSLGWCPYGIEQHMGGLTIAAHADAVSSPPRTRGSRDLQVVSSSDISETLNNVPDVSVDYVFAERSMLDRAQQWLKGHRADIMQPKEETDNG